MEEYEPVACKNKAVSFGVKLKELIKLTTIVVEREVVEYGGESEKHVGGFRKYNR